MRTEAALQNDLWIEQLVTETDFLRYVELLDHVSKEYVVMIAVSDTPWGPVMSPEMTCALKKIGLQEDLYGKFRQSYATVIDAGVLVFEELSPSLREIVEKTFILGQDEIKLRSVSYDAPPRTEAYIRINGKTVSTTKRGLNIVVYDKEKQEVLDAVNFDMYAPEFTGVHSALKEGLVKDYLVEHPGTLFACFNLPLFPKEVQTRNELFIEQKQLNLSMILEHPDREMFAIHRYYDKEEISELLQPPAFDTDAEGIRCLAEYQGEMLHISQGHRMTELQPERKRRTVFLLGDENVFGVGVSDLHTNASFLQAMFDQYLPEEGIVVENYGQYFAEGMKWKELKAVLHTLPVCPQGGDIILWNTEQLEGIPFIDMAAAAAVTRDVDLFLDKKHYTPHGHKLIAERLYQGLIEEELLPTAYLRGNARYDSLPFVKETGLSVGALRAETDAREYLKKLKEFAKKYTVSIVSHGTPWGKWFAEEDLRLLADLGLQTDRYQEEDNAYAAVIDEGTVMLEKYARDQSIEVEGMLEGNRIALRSWARLSEETAAAYIQWNEDKVITAQNNDGLYFVTYDKWHQMVLDAVSFDALGKRFLPSTDVDYVECWMAKHPDVLLGIISGIHFPGKNFTENENYILENHIKFNDLPRNLQDPDFVLHRYYTREEITEVVSVPESYYDSRGVRHFYDRQGHGIHIVGGHRVTAFQPKTPGRTLYLVGGCSVFGVGSQDAHTLASNLQNLLNQNCPEEEIIVQNYGYFLCQAGDRVSQERGKILESLPVKSGDIVLIHDVDILPDLCTSLDIPYLDVSHMAAEHRNIEVFMDKTGCFGHFTPDGYKLWAEKVYEKMLEQDLIAMAKKAEQKVSLEAEAVAYTLDDNDNSELTEYKRELIEFHRELYTVTEGAVSDAVAGAIVMNCNPFTLGHRYLIEQALKQCDYLVIFVVEEDRSIFPFEDRLQLVLEGTADLPNVVVIPSGRFIISSLTFSDYFNKSELQERVVDTSMDVLLFAQEIAPCLHIKKRFAGEEPLDAVTRQYNESMKKILPEHGIEFIEIPREGMDGEVISASRVRALLEKKDFDAVRTLVPDTTFRYLCEKFQKEYLESRE